MAAFVQVIRRHRSVCYSRQWPTAISARAISQRSPGWIRLRVPNLPYECTLSFSLHEGTARTGVVSRGGHLKTGQ